jgi:hypothetical protein
MNKLISNGGIHIFEILINPITGKRLNSLDGLFFKKMFGEEGCKNLVNHLIKCILEDLPFPEDTAQNNDFQNIANKLCKFIADNINLENILFLNPSSDDIVSKKDLITDIKLETDDYFINIESRIKPQTNFNMGIFSYPEDLDIGEDYSKLKKVISITLLDEKIKTEPNFHKIGRYGSFNYIEDPDETIAIYHTIQVSRILEIPYDLNNKLHRLLIFLNKDTPEELYKKVIERDEVLQKAYHILDTTTKNKEEMTFYEMKLKAGN